MDQGFIISKGTSYMQSKNYHFPDGWIEACLQWLFEEHNHEFNKVTLEKWCHLIEQQWLFTDLRDLEMSSALGQKNLLERTVFTGIICLQIMQFEDVSKPYYVQIQSLTNAINDNNDVGNEQESQTSRRVLQLHLTDGVNTLKGFEFESWNHIRTDEISCGRKCQLQGPFTTRNGIAFLKQGNIKILGGEVEEMKNIPRNADLEDLLQKNVMKLKMGSKGKTNTLSRQKIKEERKIESRTKTESCPMVRDLPSIDDFRSANARPPAIVHTNVAAIVESIPRTIVPKNEPQKQTSDCSIRSNAPSPKNSTQETCVDFDDDDDEFLKAVEEMPDVKVNVEAVIEKPPCTSLIDIFKELADPDSNTIVSKQYRVKAVIVKFLTKLTTEMDAAAGGVYRWKLVLRVSDGTSSLDCQLSDGFMAARIGFSAQSFHELRHGNTIEQLKDAIKIFQKSISQHNCGLFVLQLSESCDKIEVVDFEMLEAQEVEELKERVVRLAKQQ